MNYLMIHLLIILNEATGESIPEEIKDKALSPVPTGRPPKARIFSFQ